MVYRINKINRQILMPVYNLHSFNIIFGQRAVNWAQTKPKYPEEVPLWCHVRSS